MPPLIRQKAELRQHCERWRAPINIHEALLTHQPLTSCCAAWFRSIAQGLGTPALDISSDHENPLLSAPGGNL